MRGLVFEPPHVGEGEPEPQDVVQLHLEHRLVKRLISRFVSQGFRATVGRITAVIGPNPSPRVVLIGRLSLFGPAARRLHEEIIPITAAWRDIRRDESPLTPFAEAGEATTIEQLDEALRDGRLPGAAVLDRLGADRGARHRRPAPLSGSAGGGIREGRDQPSLPRTAAARPRRWRRCCSGRSTRCATPCAARSRPPPPEQMDLFGPSRGRNPETDRNERCASSRPTAGPGTASCSRLQNDLETEPEKVREGYEVQARRLEPVGLVYLWPATN